MTERELQDYIRKEFPTENEQHEWKEFSRLKHAVRGKEGEDLASYVSAISNMEGGHLVVGVKDKTLEITGIKDFANYNKENIKKTLTDCCINLNTEGLEINEITTSDSQKTVWIMAIPKHFLRSPVYVHGKAWQRLGDSLMVMTKERKDHILNEVEEINDWSAGIIPEASIRDLDENAISRARVEYVKRNPKYEADVQNWDDAQFLNKAKLTIRNRITRAAMILLGKEEEEHLLGSAVKIRWNLKSIANEDKDFEVFSIPFLLTVDQVFMKIRNLKYRYIRDSTLFPEEFLRYEPFNIRESLHNAIAHQDYTKHARINVVEFEDDHLVFSNYGTFLPHSVENVVLKDTPEEKYRNPFLVEAMKNLNMIETQGGGIRKIFNFQKQRGFPMPVYDFSDGKVKVTIIGRVMDEEFARILIQNPDLSLDDILLLDKVQKQLPVTEPEYRYLKKLRFVEGRRPNIYLSYRVAQNVNDDNLKAQYIANRSFDDQHFKDMIMEYLGKFPNSKKSAIMHLLIPKLSDALSEKQKENKIQNLLSALRIDGKIKSVGYGIWCLV